MSSQITSSGDQPAAKSEDGDRLPGQSSQRTGFDRSGLSRVFNPPKLEKKHSSGDLISRLKTRKILGVGETDNGDIHRSKISQVLGHNEHLYIRLPKGFWITHACLGTEVTVEAILLFFAPSFAVYLGIFPPAAEDEVYPAQAVRMVGGALFALLVFIWSLLGTTDKQYARMVLMAILTYHAFAAFMTGGTALIQGSLTERWIRLGIGLRTTLCLICLGYFHRIGEPGSGFRKTSSYRDISKDESKSEIFLDNYAESDDKKEK